VSWLMRKVKDVFGDGWKDVGFILGCGCCGGLCL